MNAPPVQYVKTSDGWDIAYTACGEGPTLVFLAHFWSHSQFVWDAPDLGVLLERLTRSYFLIHYDARGQGLSQRGLPADTSLDSFELDLQAVVDKLRLNRPVLLADGPWAHVAVRYAARRPSQVAGVILMRCAVSQPPDFEWFTSMASQNWELFLQLMPPNDFSAELRATAIERMRAAMTQEDMVQTLRAWAPSNLSSWLPRLEMPVLVLYPLDQPWFGQEAASQTAALIPNSRLEVVRGSGVLGDPAEIANTIERFTADLAASHTTTPATLPLAESLSARELEVLRLLAQGKSNPEIAMELFITRNTVQNHVSSILSKTNLLNRAQAAVYAKERGIV